MPSKTALKRVRDLVIEDVERTYERASQPKRARVASNPPFARNAPETPLVPKQPRVVSTKPSASSPRALSAETPTSSYLFTFTGALRHVLDSLQSPPLFHGLAEGQTGPINTVDEDLEDVLLNHPHSGKVS